MVGEFSRKMCYIFFAVQIVKTEINFWQKKWQAEAFKLKRKSYF